MKRMDATPSITHHSFFLFIATHSFPHTIMSPHTSPKQSTKRSPTRSRGDSEHNDPAKSAVRPYPYASGRSSPTATQRPVVTTDPRLFEQVQPRLWAIQPEEELVGDTAMTNGQALLLRLQTSQTYASAHIIRRLCELNKMFEEQSEGPETQTLDLGSINDLQDREYLKYKRTTEGLECRISVVETTLSRFDNYCQRRVAFSRDRTLDSFTYLHRPYVMNGEAGSSIKKHVDRTLDAREARRARREQRSKEKSVDRSGSESPVPVRRRTVIPECERCIDHEDLGVITPHWPELCPKKHGSDHEQHSA